MFPFAQHQPLAWNHGEAYAFTFAVLPFALIEVSFMRNEASVAVGQHYGVTVAGVMAYGVDVSVMDFDGFWVTVGKAL